MGLAPVFAFTDLSAANINQLPVVVSTLALGSVSNSNAETIIGTFTIPAGTITAVNQGFMWMVAGTCGGTASPNLTLQIRVNNLAGTIIGKAGANAVSVSNGWWILDGWMLFNQVGTSGTFSNIDNNSQNFSGALVPVANGTQATTGTAFNTTISNSLVVTALFSVANASNVAATTVGNLYQL